MAEIAFDSTGGGTSITRAYILDMKLVSGAISFDDSYASGGESMNLSRYFNKLLGVIIESKNGYTFSYDYTNKKVQAFTAPDTEVADETDLSALTGVRFLAWGI